MIFRPSFFASLLLSIFVPSLLSAAVTRIEIKTREPYLEGRAFDGIGSYERLRGKAFFAVDPKHVANQTVIDLELAPKNDAGLVEFSTDVELLAPQDLSKANGAMLYDVNNRGGKLALGMFNTGADEFLMRKGYVVIWSGWIAETQPGGGRLRLTAPVATENGKPLIGPVRAEFVIEAPAERHTLAMWANQGCYEPTERGEREAVLTWRSREKDARVVIPRQQWRLEKRWIEDNGERGQLPLIELVVAGGLQPGYIYEVVYEAQGSIVQGLGLAGIRDLLSFLKHEASAKNPLFMAEPRKSSVKFTYGFGVSQSGRCLRQFLYDGFNADESGRQVFDGVIPHVAGGGLGFFNHRFASPTRHNGQHDNHLFPADQFPFTYGDEIDSFTGREDGILHRDRARGTVPKVLHTQSSSEYWHRAGSLVHTDPLGKRDAKLPPEVRVYCFGGTQHGAGGGFAATAPGNGQLIGNPADYRPLLRALLTALDEWVRTGQEPPPSVHPRIADGTLVGWRESESGWHGIPGVRYPEVIQQPEQLDRGPEFYRFRRTTIEPPISRGMYVVNIPKCGPDNNELGTLLLPAVAVPVATYTSWNTRNRSVGAENEMLGLQGGYIPFVKTQAEREQRGDPRPALLERYRNFADYRQQYRAVIDRMIEQRTLLSEDVPGLMNLADRWRPLFE
ncbi:MAG: alpha/beta hydrolase domain-containing protein [Planctomycetaceae bacterium]